MRISIRDLRRLIREAGVQLELPFPGPELQDIARQGHEINAQIKAEQDRVARNELYGARSALVDELREYRKQLLRQLRVARDAGDQEELDRLGRELEQVTYVASVDVMGYRGPTSEVFLTQRDVYGGDPKKRPWGLGT